MSRTALAAALLAAVTATSTACSASPGASAPATAPTSDSPTSPSVPSPAGPSTSSPGTSSAGTRTGPAPASLRVSDTLVTGLDVPWGIAVAADGTAFVAQREGTILRRSSSGRITTLGAVPGVRARGEGGLLGLAIAPDDPDVLLAYLTTNSDNRVVRLPVEDDRLGSPQSILTGIPAAGNHNGGRLLAAPDGTVFVATGDASDRPSAQDPDSLGGKILRITATGAVPADNPAPGSPVYSLGHRNVQGLALDSSGNLWATEFGQNTWDELNLIRPGANYGWPQVEGRGGDGRYVDPVVVWRTDEASPSGLAIVDDVAYVAALKGRRLWQVDIGGGRAVGRPRAFFSGELGRLRTVLPAPGGPGAAPALWLTTSNTDGRGNPSRLDDRLLLVQLR